MGKMIADVPAGYVTTPEAAERLGVSRKTLTRWCESGRIAGAERQSWKLASGAGFRWLVPARWVRDERRRRQRLEVTT